MRNRFKGLDLIDRVPDEHGMRFMTLYRRQGSRPSPRKRKCTGHSKNTREDSTHGHHQMVNTEIRLIIFFAAKDGETLYSQQKQDRELTVAQIMNSLLPNSDLN